MMTLIIILMSVELSTPNIPVVVGKYGDLELCKKAGEAWIGDRFANHPKDKDGNLVTGMLVGPDNSRTRSYACIPAGE